MKKILLITASTLTIGLAAMLVLTFGNVQWHSTVYRWQCYAYPKYKDAVIPMPTNYTGAWKHWYKDGTLEQIGVYKNGEPSGISISYHENGNINTCANHYHEGQVCKGFDSNFDKVGNLIELRLWDGSGPFSETNSAVLFSRQKNINLINKYEKKVKAYNAELKKFEKEYGLTASPPIKIKE